MQYCGVILTLHDVTDRRAADVWLSVFIFPTSWYGYGNYLTWIKTAEIPIWCERILSIKPFSVGSAIATGSMGCSEEFIVAFSGHTYLTFCVKYIYI